MLRPALLFQEEWKQPATAAEHPDAAPGARPGGGGLNVPLTGASNNNPELEVESFVPAGELRLVKEGSAENGNNPLHVWTGLCTSACAVAFRDKRDFADLSGLARIRFNTKMSGFHQVRPIVKLADGTWWIGNQAIGTASDWLESEISFADLRWLKLDMPGLVTRGNLVDKIDLSKVDEIGFADLMAGSGHGPGGAADVAQVEVYGRAVARSGQD
ncbi:MAG TPA: hypothetical protein VHY19_01565 [Steroidobacteraceae bacterium]|jgi:hypothetical protein|nr:hypothetical protein [Steroidobacteraceae bacterium]